MFSCSPSLTPLVVGRAEGKEATTPPPRHHHNASSHLSLSLSLLHIWKSSYLSAGAPQLAFLFFHINFDFCSLTTTTTTTNRQQKQFTSMHAYTHNKLSSCCWRRFIDSVCRQIFIARHARVLLFIYIYVVLSCISAAALLLLFSAFGAEATHTLTIIHNVM